MLASTTHETHAMDATRATQNLAGCVLATTLLADRVVVMAAMLNDYVICTTADCGLNSFLCVFGGDKVLAGIAEHALLSLSL